jgi:hypothetical protein
MHKRFQDPKVRLIIDFMTERCQRREGWRNTKAPRCRCITPCKGSIATRT